MNKLCDLFVLTVDLFLLTVVVSVIMAISVDLQANLNTNSAPASTNISIDLPSDFPGDLRENGWHFYIYKESRGILCYGNQCLIALQINDYYVTPWGNCYWHATTGWQFHAAKGPIGNKLEVGDL